jgi:hypothetical protein
LIVASDEQYESIPDDEIVLLVRKFYILHKFCKERRKSPRGCFECDNTAHFITDYPNRKKLDSSNKYNYNNWNNFNCKGDNKKKYHFGDNKKKKISRGSCPKRVLHSLTLTSPVMTPPAHRRKRRSSAVRRLHQPLPHGQIFKKHLRL